MVEFEIPLLSDSSSQAIGTSFSKSDIAELAEECGRDFDNDGPEAVAKYYPLLRSVMGRFVELDQGMRDHYWTVVIHAIEALCQKLGSSDIHHLSADEKRVLRKTTKMLCYVAVRMVDLYEREITSVSNASASRKKKGSSAMTGIPRGGKEKLVSLMSQLVELELCQLWEPPTTQVMEAWSNLIGHLCYKILENSSITRNAPLRNQVVHLLGVLVQHYGQALSVSVKAIQLLQHFDHLVSPLAQALALFSTQFNCRSIIGEVVRELGGKDPRDLAADASGTRSFATFLVELCHLTPECVLLSISVLLPHLNGESYTFRNGVLGVIVELLLFLHTCPMDDQRRQLRDSLFEKLEEHVHDTTAFVRVKVLQLMLQLVHSQAIPLPRVHVEVALVAGRLRDKSSSVRKAALQLLSCWLSHNPFAGKLDKAEFEQKLRDEESRLQQLVESGTTDRHDSDELSGIPDDLKQAALVNYYKDALHFINALQNCVPVTVQLLGSKVTSDVLESLDFLCVANEFELSGASEGLRKAVVLIWSRDESIKKALINTYSKLYFTFESKVQRTKLIVDNLLLLTQQSSPRELVSLHQLVSVLVSSGQIPATVLNSLIKVTVEDSPTRSRLAARVIVMMSSSKPAIISSNLQLLVDTGFPHTSPDLIKAKYICQTFQNLAGKEKRSHVERFSPSHAMFTRVLAVLIASVDSDTCDWCPLAEQALTMVYKLSSEPEAFAQDLLRDTVKLVLPEGDSDGDVESLVLSRLLFCVGHIALLEMVHCEVVVAMEIKRKRAAVNASQRTTTRKSLGGDEGLELTGATADDSEAEIIKRILDTEVGGASGLLALFEPLLVGVVSNPSRYSCHALQTSACLSLSKYMLISSSICEKYLQLLFTVLEKSSVESVRANAVIAASDLVCRFPNLLEPWTPYIYARLSDHSHLVRRNALTVLTHLILNDMIKVRGQISSVARCLEDSNSVIADLAKLFFHELSQKGNALYNVLPDIVSHLSDANSTLSETSFQNIVKFLFGFIQKDRLCEGIVEKLCHRFRAARSIEQHHNLAYCLTLLPGTERSLRKLQENIHCYQDKLVDTQVFSSFIALLNKVKKVAKPDLKSQVEEFELKLQTIHTKGLNEEERPDHEDKENKPQGEPNSEVAMATPTKAIEDFSSDVVTSARRSLIRATPTSEGSLGRVLTHKSNRYHRLETSSNEEEISDQIPRLNLELT